MTVKQTPSRDGSQLRFDRPLVLLVEGPDDQAFSAKILATFFVADRWHVHSMAGNSTPWPDAIRLALADDWFSDYGVAIGLVLDSDADVGAADAKARGFLTRAGLASTSAPGDVLVSHGRRIGYFLMPDGAQPGALEELLLRAAADERVELATDYVATVTAQFGAPRHPTKAVLQAYFAGQREHVKSIPVAVEKNEVVPVAHEAFDDFRAFLSALEA